MSPSANNVNGFDTTSLCLRSILMHPIGLLLASLLNEKPLPEIFYTTLWNDLREDVKEWLSTYNNSCSSSNNVRDTILTSAMSEWNTKNENDLTNKIEEKINIEIEKKTLDGYGTVEDDASLMIQKEKVVNDGAGRVDFIVSKKSRDENQSKRSVVMVVEFGMRHGNWWEKLSQILSYFKLLRQTQEKNYIVDQPVLLTVVTMKKPDPNDTSNVDPVAQFGVFLCIPKNKNQYRLSLLWRANSYDVNDASKQFGKILYAAKCCADLREYLASTVMNHENKPSYQYLGPNCCRIGDYVSIGLCKKIGSLVNSYFHLPDQSLCHSYFIHCALPYTMLHSYC
jgi:hypothetical protein